MPEPATPLRADHQLTLFVSEALARSRLSRPTKPGANAWDFEGSCQRFERAHMKIGIIGLHRADLPPRCTERLGARPTTQQTIEWRKALNGVAAASRASP